MKGGKRAERQAGFGFGFRKGNGNNGRKRKIFPEKSNPRVRERATFCLFRSSSNQCPSPTLCTSYLWLSLPPPLSLPHAPPTFLIGPAWAQLFTYLTSSSPSSHPIIILFLPQANLVFYFTSKIRPNYHGPTFKVRIKFFFFWFFKYF